jgi:hypothetical protein
MGKSRSILIGTLEFATAGEAKEHVRGLVARYADGDTANEADSVFLRDLLELHPRCEEKIGAGVRSFKIDRNPEYTNTRTIFVVRADNSETDFSWPKCIDGETPERLKRAALRNAVADQIAAFKKEAFSRPPVMCPETGEELSWKYCHVDHAAPNTFDSLVDQWLLSENIVLDSVQISPSRDISFTRLLTDDGQRESWRAFHDQRKQLRLLSPHANLSIAKRKKGTVPPIPSPKRSKP